MGAVIAEIRGRRARRIPIGRYREFASTVAAEKIKMAAPVATSEIITSFISLASIFFPRYSGVLPTISPAMKMVTRQVSIIEMRPEPVPPKITSPFLRLKS